MINILHTIDTTGPGGAETVFLNLVSGLDRKRFNPIVAIPGQGWVNDELVRNGIKPIFISSKGSFSVRYLLQLIDIVRKHKIDIIQSHLIGSNVYCSIAGILCGVPVISTIHGFVDTDKHDRISKLRFFFMNHGSKRIVFVSNQLKDHFIKEYNIRSEKAVTIYNGIDLEVYRDHRSISIRKELGLDSRHILIGSIGNIREAKGYDYLLQAADVVIRTHPECRFVIAGEGSGPLYNKLLTLNQSLGLEEKVFFLGFRKDVSEILNNFDIFVLSSTSEGFSIVTLEAMACRIPVVVTRCGGPQEIVDDRYELTAPPADSDALAGVIMKAIEDKIMLDMCVDNSYEIVSKRFSKHAMLKEYEKSYICEQKQSNKYNGTDKSLGCLEK